MSAQKALQGSETEKRELLGDMEENNVSPITFLKTKQKKNALVARPGYGVLNVWVFNLKLKRFEHQGLVNLAKSNVVLGMREGGVLARLVEDWEGRVYDGFRRSSGVAILCAPQEAIDVEDGLLRKPQVDGQRDLTFHLGMIQHLLKANVYQALVDPEIV